MGAPRRHSDQTSADLRRASAACLGCCLVVCAGLSIRVEQKAIQQTEAIEGFREPLGCPVVRLAPSLARKTSLHHRRRRDRPHLRRQPST